MIADSLEFGDGLRRKIANKKKPEPKLVVPPFIPADQYTFDGRAPKSETIYERNMRLARESAAYDVKVARERAERHAREALLK